MARLSRLNSRFFAALLAVLVPAVLGSVLDGVDLTNFQQEYPCNVETLIVRPRNVQDIQNAVLLHDTIQAAGAGHSWNEPFFCAALPAATNPSPGAASPPAGPSARSLLGDVNASSNVTGGPYGRPTSADIAMTTMRPLTIQVNATDESVWVDAAVITADLLEYLSNYVTEDASAGWTLPAFPWFVYQTIAGAISTGSHGSSIPWGSLSSKQQLLALELVLADGSLRLFTPETDPFLFRALRVSLGNLGVITRAKLRIIREVPVRRELTKLTPPAFLEMMQQLQEAALAGGEEDPAKLPPWARETEWFWIPQKYEFMMVGYTRADPNKTAAATALQSFKPDNTTVFQSKGDMLRLGEIQLSADAVINFTTTQLADNQPLAPEGVFDEAAGGGRLYERAYEALKKWDAVINRPLNITRGEGDPALGGTWTVPPHNAPSVFYAAANMAEGSNEISRIGILQLAGNATVESTAAYIKQPNATLPQLRRTLYDQYEVSFPLTAAYDCFSAVLETAYGSDLLGAQPANRAVDKGFRTAPLIRMVGAEDGLLAHTHDGPRIFLNIEDYLFYNQGRRPNQKFRAIMATLTGDKRCTARGPAHLHWGKAGWPDPGCWHGDEQYGNNWCSFGCAMRTLDPEGKFRDSAPDRWNWAGVDLGSCCGPQGFEADKEVCVCKVKHARSMEQCAPPPFYTNR